MTAVPRSSQVLCSKKVESGEGGGGGGNSNNIQAIETKTRLSAAKSSQHCLQTENSSGKSMVNNFDYTYKSS